MGSDEHFIPRNYRIGILNGALWMGGSAFLDPDAVVAVFLLGLGASKFVVGIAAAASMVGFLLPTLLMAHLIEAAEHKLRYYYLSMASRVLTLGVLVVSVLLLGPSHPRVLCGLAIALLCGYNASIAVGVLPFFEVVGHSVPPRRRGRFFAWRMVLGNALAIAAGVAVAWLLNEERSGLTFSQSFAVVFGLGLLLCGTGSAAFCLCKEPAMPVDRRGMGLRAKLREGWRLAREDGNYRRLLVCRVAMAAMGMAGAFYVVYCLKFLGTLEAHPERAAVFLIAGRLAMLVAYPIWAWVSDSHGSARLLRVTAVLGLLPPLLALGLPLVPADHMAGRWGLAVGLYVIYRAVTSGFHLGATNYVMELAPRERRPLYIAMGFAWVTPVVFLAAPFGGWLADAFRAGHQITFALAIGFAAVTAFVAFGLAEPREAQHIHD